MREAAEKLHGEHDYRNLCKMDVANGVTNFTRKILSTQIQVLHNRYGRVKPLLSGHLVLQPKFGILSHQFQLHLSFHWTTTTLLRLNFFARIGDRLSEVLIIPVTNINNMQIRWWHWKPTCSELKIPVWQSLDKWISSLLNSEDLP